MSPELDKKLIAAFPKLYRVQRMLWGFECGDGWYDLLYELSAELEALIDPDEEFPICAVQVKEKFGGLRFYLSSETEEMSELIHKAEVKSEHTCEICGAPGRPRGGGWIAVLCNTHEKEILKI